MASGTGLWNDSARGWDPELVEALGLDVSRLPVVSDEPLRRLRPELARRFPALADVPFFPAVGDGALANVGSGASGPSVAGLTVGTSGALRVLVPAPVPAIPDVLFRYRLDARRVVVGGSLSTGGNLWPWLERTLASVREDDVLAVPPDSHGLTVLRTSPENGRWTGRRRDGGGGRPPLPHPARRARPRVSGGRDLRLQAGLRLPRRPLRTADHQRLRGRPGDVPPARAHARGRAADAGGRVTRRGSQLAGGRAVRAGAAGRPWSRSGAGRHGAGDPRFEPHPDHEAVYARAIERQHDLRRRLKRKA